MVDEGTSAAPGGAPDPRPNSEPVSPLGVTAATVGLPGNEREDAAVPVRVDTIGIQTRQEKAALEAALFGSPSRESVVRIAHYEVIGTLGAGGMGSVYAAEHVDIRKPFAVKLLDVPGRSKSVAIDRFVQEARAASRIQHPHVVAITDFGADGNDELDNARRRRPQLGRDSASHSGWPDRHGHRSCQLASWRRGEWYSDRRSRWRGDQLAHI